MPRASKRQRPSASKPAKKQKKSSGRTGTVGEYLAALPQPARDTLKKLRATIRSVAPKEATEVLSYGIPTFKYKGGLVAYAAFKKHCSFFPLGSSVLDEFAEEIEEFRVAKGTLHFPLDKPLPPAVLKKIVRARIRQNEARLLRRS